ncbi:hypothetical protein KIH74_25135 [Kineosporia sp. J2-2]|uniref:Integral membrane protein n=1 Tax=Kineosporia corallincola TaxID=2835133 RepID=A0ABS5TQU4_9ACTN|nr:hypothetical protein [Kineosporia corallincola]MBT0772254.1 hypothetical protein [Kineosporia corallincola]
MKSGPFRFSPASVAGYAELIIRRRVDRARARQIHGPGDVGASVVEWVVISALLVGIAAAVGAVLLQKLRDKADSINLDTGGI